MHEFWVTGCASIELGCKIAVFGYQSMIAPKLSVSNELRNDFGNFWFGNCPQSLWFYSHDEDSPRLQSDLRFRFQCGFRITQEAPSIATLSRVFDRIVHKGLLESLFYDLVSQCNELRLIDGSHVAIDSTAIQAYEKKQPKS